MGTWLRKAVAVSTTRSVLILSLAITTADLKAQSTSAPSAMDESSSQQTSKDTEAMAKELEAIKQRVAQLEAELKARTAAPAPPAARASIAAGPAQQTQQPSTPATGEQVVAPGEVKPSEPFAYADWTWLNGTPRNKDVVWDSKFFTPEVRFDTNFIHSFNHPQDDSIGGSTETFRSNEVQLEQISFGGDFHWQNVRGRILTMGGMFGVSTPRNDASSGRGQWDLRGAYR